MITPDNRYRPCVGVTLINAEGLVFIGHRKAKGTFDQTTEPYLWQMPQGGIDAGETPYEAALRELQEETNVASVEFLAEAPLWLSYDLPPEANKRWSGKYIGQTQRWFALRFVGSESEIDIHAPGGGKHKPEFDDWRWEKLSRLPDLIVPFKRQVYLDVVEAFRPFAAA
ncbi:RNA pyrophosphohydrolase [Methylocystis iwaonis]|uniref:RNA pyrophosphohydrolase n=1 Tax=Methylocystis iwaonis TaxID=2885079 RepID=A0ABM8E6S1_9HYPH|nr:RNA pyrophosphohydrolase [Methylocystis iwaonis]BDV33539.1 RNA pyrophosphohydrolase [Methylocystis iwaonis]